MTFQEAWKFTQTVPGSFYPQEAEVLWSCAERFPGGVVVEVGCERGRSTSVIAQAMNRNGILIVIDPFVSHAVSVEPDFRANMDKLGVPYVLHTKRTQELGPLPPHINLVHIDGDHLYEGVKFDCELLLPRVVVGGFACFHDYRDKSWPGVRLAVDEWLDAHPEWAMHAIAHSLLAIRRTE